MSAVASVAGYFKKHVLGQTLQGDLETVEIATRLERTPRGKTPLIVHRPPVHEVLRGHGIEPLFTR